MATVDVTNGPAARGFQNVAHNWIGLANGDVGEALEIGHRLGRCVQVLGTFGTGGSVTIQGSIDGTTWATLEDPRGDALTFAAAGLGVIEAPVPYIRPSVTAGDGTTDLDVWVSGIGGER